MTRRDAFLDDTLRQARTGDGRAWRVLYTHLIPRMREAAIGFSGLDHEALVHDVFFNCWRKDFRGYRGGSLVAYVVRAVRNRCIDETRSRRQTEIPLDDAPDLRDRTAYGPEERVIRQDFIVWAFNQGRVSDQDRRLLVLDAQGYSNLEIADRLAMTPGQVAVRIHRTRRRLKEAVGLGESPARDRFAPGLPGIRRLPERSRRGGPGMRPKECRPTPSSSPPPRQASPMPRPKRSPTIPELGVALCAPLPT